MTTGKTIALTRWTFVDKVMSLLLNMLSRLVITFLPRSKCLLISWLQSPSTVILESPKIKSDTVSTVSPSISHEVMGPDALILVFWSLPFREKPRFCSRQDSPQGRDRGPSLGDPSLSSTDFWIPRVSHANSQIWFPVFQDFYFELLGSIFGHLSVVSKMICFIVYP